MSAPLLISYQTDMRLFTGIDLPEHVATNLSGLLERLRLPRI